MPVPAPQPFAAVRQRDLCTDCNRSRSTCFCRFTHPFGTQSRFLILMHPREFKRQRTGTGRVTRKSLLNSEIIVGVDFTHHDGLNRALSDKSYFPVLLFPGQDALAADSSEFADRTGALKPLVVILDATWASARKMLNSSANLQALQRISFAVDQPSRFAIKRQPQELCLSTIEAVFRLLQIFDLAGIERLDGRHAALMETLDAIVAFQLRCAADPALPSHRTNGKQVVII